jgi:hypothetical protein
MSTLQIHPLLNNTIWFFRQILRSTKSKPKPNMKGVTDRILVALQVNDLARVVKRKGAPPTWMATKTFAKAIERAEYDGKSLRLDVVPCASPSNRLAAKRSLSKPEAEIARIVTRHRKKWRSVMTIDLGFARVAAESVTANDRRQWQSIRRDWRAFVARKIKANKLGRKNPKQRRARLGSVRPGSASV